MKTRTTKILRHDIGVSETTLKRTKATKLDIAMLSEQMLELKGETSRDLEASRNSLGALGEKMAAVDTSIDSIGSGITQCQNVIVAVKDTLLVQTGQLTVALRDAENQHRGRSAAADEKLKAIDDRMTAMAAQEAAMEGRMNEADEALRSVDEKHVRRFEALQDRLQMLEEHMPKLEAEMKALDAKADRIELFQQKINARIVTVMRMSLAIIGVVAVAAMIVLGLIFFK